jgi:hypothetical protein
VVSQVVSGQAVLLDLEKEDYFGLDEIGSQIWGYLQEGKQPDWIVNAMQAQFEVDEPKLASDIENLLDELESNGLIFRD